jgi:hypothetical protein
MSSIETLSKPVKVAMANGSSSRPRITFACNGDIMCWRARSNAPVGPYGEHWKLVAETGFRATC